MNKSLAAGLIAVAAVAGGAAWWWNGQAGQGAATGPEASASAPRPPQTVTLVAVQVRDVPVVIEASANVVPLHSVEIRPQTTSVVRQVALQEGQNVRKGQLLFQLDDRTEAANLDRARATLARDRATLADLERQWKRAQELRSQNFISQAGADTVLAQLEAQRALLLSDEAAMKAAEVALSQTRLLAPFNARAGAVNVNPGSLVTPTATAAAMVTLNQMDPIGVSFSVPEAQLGALLRGGEAGKGATGAKVSVLLPPAGPGRNAPRETLEGEVRFIDNTVDATSGTIKVKAEVANPKQMLWPGQYATVRLQLRTLKDASVVPQAALVIRGQERFVYVADADNKAELRKVQVRFNAGEQVAVEGVSGGEKVVLEGKQNLRPGVPLKEAPARAGKAASGAGAASAASSATSGAASGARP